MKVEVVEPTGPDLYADLNFGGREIMARLPADVAVAAGKTARFSIDHSRTILFDEESGRALS